METHNHVSLSYEWLHADDTTTRADPATPAAPAYTTDPATRADPVKVAVVKLERSDKLNGLTLPMLRELSSIARTLAKDTQLRGVIITGEGRSFTAGLDFECAFSKPLDIVRGFVPDLYGTNLFQRACWDWRRLPVPVIAVVQGHCFGGGVQLALGADFRVTTPTSTWSVLETKWGLIPDMSGARTLADAVHPDVAKWLAMSGEHVSGDQAVELGLATWLAEDTAAAQELARDKLVELAGRSPDQLAAAKRLFGNSSRSPRATFRHERVEQITLLLRENTRRARLAALQKMPPRFARRGTWLSR